MQFWVDMGHAYERWSTIARPWFPNRRCCLLCADMELAATDMARCRTSVGPLVYQSWDQALYLGLPHTLSLHELDKTNTGSM